MAYEIARPVTWDTVSATLAACPVETKATALQYIGSCASSYGADAQDVDMYLPEILQELDRPSAGKDVKLGVLSMLSALGPRAVASCYTTHIESLLADAQQEVRYEACLTLVTAGMLLEGAAPAMVRLLSDKSDMVRYGACAALGSIKQQSYASEVMKLLEDPSPEVQGMACVSLAQMGATEQYGAIATRLATGRSRVLCLQAFALMGAGGAAHLDAVVDCLTDPSEDVREAAVAAVKALATARSPNDATIKKVSAQLLHQDGQVRVAACRALGSMGAVAVLVNVPTLQDMLDDSFCMPVYTPLSLGGARPPAAPEARKVRCAAAMALAVLGEEAPEGVPECVRKLIVLSDPETTTCAMEALAKMGPAARPQAGYIMDVLKEDSASVRAKAATALAATGDVACAKEIVGLLKDPVALVREAALHALANMELQGEVSYVSKVYERVQDSSPSVCVAAIDALAMTAQGQHYASLLAQRLRVEQAPEVLVATVKALAQMGERGAACAEDVAVCLDSPTAIVRAAAAKSLGQMPYDDAGCFLRRLREMQLDQDEAVCEAARDAVQNLTGSEPKYLMGELGVADGE